MSELGYVGLIAFLLLIVSTILNNIKTMKMARQDEDKFIYNVKIVLYREIKYIILYVLILRHYNECLVCQIFLYFLFAFCILIVCIKHRIAKIMTQPPAISKK